MPAKNPETIAFMRTVMDRLGVQTPTELANLLVSEGTFAPNEFRKILKWCAGDGSPNHASTMRLTKRAELV